MLGPPGPHGFLLSSALFRKNKPSMLTLREESCRLNFLTVWKESAKLRHLFDFYKVLPWFQRQCPLPPEKCYCESNVSNQI